jgi:quercetin dioxygenase-like cupin family protein
MYGPASLGQNACARQCGTEISTLLQPPEKHMTQPVKSPYRIAAAEVPTFGVAPPSQEAPSTIRVRMVYGTDTGMMIARRDKGYHSRPHTHDSEQWNYIMDGEIWFFINEEGFRCRQGDIVRIPRNAVHWTWVRCVEGCQMLETHTPSLTGDPDLSGGALALVGPGETPDLNGVTNIFIDFPQAGEIERRALEADPDPQ